MDDPKKEFEKSSESEESETESENQIAEERNMNFIDAAEEGDNDTVNRLLDEGAKITSTRLGYTGLHLSAVFGHQSVVLTLLTRGLDINIRGGWGSLKSTALMRAAEYGQLPCVQTLLEHGALIDLKDGEGYTALMKAAKGNYLDIVAELLSRQADVNIVNDYKKNALQYAEEKNNQDVVRILKVDNNKDALNKEMLAAADEGKQRLVHALITAGADLETRDEYNNTALHISAKKGHESVVRILLQLGIDVNRRQVNKFTPLITAARYGHHKIAKLLMRSGADLNLQSGHGWTALIYAVIWVHISIVYNLLEAGADRDIKNYKNETALQQAKEKGLEEIVKILERGKIQTEDEIAGKAVLAATEAGCTNVVSDLLVRGANMETRNDMGETPFQIAARLPKTRKDEFEEYLHQVEKRDEIKPKETLDSIVKEAEIQSRKLIRIFLSQSLNKHDPASISNYVFDIVNFSNKEHFDCKVFGDDQKFYLKYDKEEGKETLLQSVVNNSLIKDREEILEIMKKVDLSRHPGSTEQQDADFRLKKQVKKACPSSIGLRDCIQSIDEKYPWSSIKHKVMLFLSFFAFCMGTLFYGLDVYTNIRFSLKMFKYAKRNFT